MPSITLSSLEIDENAKAGDVVGSFSVEDAPGESFTFSFLNGTDPYFTIEGSNLVVKSGAVIDYELIPTLVVSVVAEGNQEVDPGFITISVTDVNEAPTDIVYTTIFQNISDAQNGDNIGVLMGVDPEVDDLTYTLTDNAGGRFTINGAGLVAVADMAKIKADATKLYQIKVLATDPAGNRFEKTLTVGTNADGGGVGVGGSVLNKIFGTKRNDKLKGTAGADLIAGGKGNDKLYGFDGLDMLSGGKGKDNLWGGAGADIFMFTEPLRKGEFDRIHDFKRSDDSLAFSLKSMKVSKSMRKKMKPGELAKKFFKIGKKAKDGDDFFLYDKKSGTVYVDQDGSSSKYKPIEIVKLKARTALGADDFFVA